MDKQNFPQLPGYEIISLIGAGGTSKVYLAEGPDGNKVAVKVLHETFAASPEVRKLLQREASTLQRVGGPGVAKLLDFHVAQDVTFLVMDYVEGETLDTLVASKPITGLLLTNTINGIIDALKSIHDAGVVHQDLKPSNVVLGPNGVTVLDFGLSVIEEASNLTRPKDLGGTPAWISPEQINGAKVTTASDVFNLGMLIAFLATGQNPFGVGKPEALLYRIANSSPDLQKLDPHLRRIVSACLGKEPSERPTLEKVVYLLQGIEDYSEKGRGRNEDRTLLASQNSIARAFDVEPDDSGPANAGRKIGWKWLSGIAAGFALISLFLLDALVFDYGGDVVFRYLNSSEKNQPQTSSTVRVVIDGEPVTITLPSSPTPKESQETVGRWNLDSFVSVTASPSFTEDMETAVEGGRNGLGLSRFRTGQDLVIEVELTDFQTNVRVGFGSQSPIARPAVIESSPRSDEAEILALEAAEEEQFLAEQRRLYEKCVADVDAGWRDELKPVLDLERDYWALRDSFSGGSGDFPEWAPKYALSESMFNQWLSALSASPETTVSLHAPYSQELTEDASFVFETYSNLLDSWSILGDTMLFEPRDGEGFLRDIYSREYMFIDIFEDGLVEASQILRSTISADSSLYCESQFPEGT